MTLFDVVERDVGSIRLPRWGRVVAVDGVVPWLMVDPEGAVVEPVRRFLLDFVAQDNRPGSVRSYAYDLLRWWRWLHAVDVAWDQATPAEVRDLVLWLRQARKPRLAGRTVSAATVGTINPVTRKQYLDDQYKPRTVQHSNAVLRTFYEFWIERGDGPLINPVQLDRRGRLHAHHNPLERFGGGGKVRYNPKIPKRRPREMGDERWDDMFAGLRCDRDRAMLALAVSNGARAAELLGIRAGDVDWGEQLVRVRRKGSGAQQWLPASSESFVWLRLYLSGLGGDPLGAGDPLWWTVRRRDRGAGLCRQPLNYEALRAVFRRVNVLLGANWSMHDLRHTAALRMSRDDTLSQRDVQTILGHAHLSTTADIYLVEDEAKVIDRVHRHLVERGHRPERPAPTTVSAGYDAADLAVLFGRTQQ